jgi:hypothetical protein
LVDNVELFVIAHSDVLLLLGAAMFLFGLWRVSK